MIKISKEPAGQIKARIKTNSNELSCGAVLGYFDGTDYNIEAILELSNERSEGRDKSYLVSPEGYIKAEAYAHSCSLQLLGFYYAGNIKVPGPSEKDLSFALPGFIYLSIAAGEPLDGISAWAISDNRKSSLKFKIEIITKENVQHEFAVAV